MSDRAYLDIDLSPSEQARDLNLPVRSLSSSVLDTAPIGMALTGPDGFVYWANRSLARLIGRPLDQVVGFTFTQLTGQRLPGTSEDGTPPGTTIVGAEQRWALRDGRVIWVTVSDSVALDAAGDPILVRGQACTILQVQDVTEQRTVKTELERSNAELTQFAYVASHDLSEPLRVIAGHVELLARRYSGQLDDRADEWIKYAVDGCTRMRSLIDDLLQFSRLGRADPEHHVVALDDIVAGATGELPDPGVVQVGALPRVSGSASELRRMFANLLGNAVRFVRPDVPARVEVAARRDGDDWLVTVDDNGIGIAPEYRDRVFGLFQRLHRQDEYPGTGIGLAVCRKVMELHFGRIWIEDSPLGGTRFCLVFPAMADSVDMSTDDTAEALS